jgi:hypothetical protein
LIRALIIGTKAATSKFESGASVRVNNIKDFLKESKFSVTLTNSSDLTQLKFGSWDLIVVVSHANASVLKLARKHTKFLWFDSTDSTLASRTSSLRKGDLKQLFLLLREIFNLRTSPELDLLTYVSKSDSTCDSFCLPHQNAALIFPLNDLSREVETTRDKRLVFIGDGSYRPNRLALKFISEVLKHYNLDYPVHVYGKDYRPVSGNFYFHGYTERGLIYKSEDIHLAPRIAGAGINLKVAIPLANGLKVITNPNGANGILPMEELLVARNQAEFAKMMVRVMTPDWKPRLSKNRLLEIFESDDKILINKILSNFQNT